MAVASISLFTVPVYVRHLGVGAWGVMALLLTALAPCSLLDLGVGPATVKYASEALGQGDERGAARIVHTAILFYLGVGLATAVVVVAASRWLVTAVFAVEVAQRDAATIGFRLVAVILAVAGITTSCSGALAASQRFDRQAAVGSTVAVASAVVSVALVLRGGGLISVVAVQAAAAVVAAILYWREACAVLPSLRALPRGSFRDFRRSLAFGAWPTFAMLGGLLANWSDRYLLGIVAGTTALGAYSVALSLEQQLYAAFYEMGDVLFPAVSERHGAGELASARHLALDGGWALCMAFGTAAATLGVVGSDFLWLWASPEIARAATPALRILVAAGIVGMSGTGPRNFAMGTARTHWLALLSVTSGVVVFAVGLSLVRTLGLPGVALGVLAGGLTQSCVLLLIWRASFAQDIALGRFAVRIWSPAAAALLSLVVLAGLHDHWAHTPSWGRLVLETAACLACSLSFQIAGSEALPGRDRRRRTLRAILAPVLQRPPDRAP